ncbi:MAG TPA: hypothetical protein VHB79_20755 [Polyangiaceae bacterium]|nr:hypothetical protein [Polyangiaceae bacterium]
MSTNNPVPAELSDAAIRNLQCNILSSTGRPRSTQVFHRFDSRRELAKWLRNDMPHPTKAGEEDHVDQVVTLLFSAEALSWLAPQELSEKLAAMDPAFVRGVRHADSSQRIKADPSKWGPHEKRWHVVEIHSHDATSTFEPAESQNCVIEYGSGYKKNGKQISQRHEESYGHFSVRDGISMPLYTRKAYDKLEQKPAGEKWTYDPRHKLSTLIVRDPLIDSDAAFGSYFAFLKYEQHKDKLTEALKKMERVIGERSKKKEEGANISTVESAYPRLHGRRGLDRVEELKRHIFGRDSSGMTAFGTDGNDFDFSSDPDGKACPFQSHIRKMNPRGRTGDVEHERSKTIARRGTSYYQTKICGEEKHVEPGAGLLFWCAQASILDQFEYIMETWAHAAVVDEDHLPTPDFDAVVGRPDQDSPSFSSWKRWKATTDMDFSIWDCVNLIGGEYLYAPSIDGVSMLRKFAEQI